MLTKNDLTQIRGVVKEEVDVSLGRELKPIKRDLKKIRKDLEFAVGVLDRDRWKLEKRVDVIESYVGLPSVV